MVKAQVNDFLFFMRFFSLVLDNVPNHRVSQEPEKYHGSKSTRSSLSMACWTCIERIIDALLPSPTNLYKLLRTRQV